MESKKQLIIVPPMSEALKKLNEVLEGIAADENIEISLIDDLKELGQVLANSGQCLILCSNAKKCATFLQDNRFIISRFHSKVMLFTPKEIPAKTLIKFTKVGLTESILENSPPKTLLYKIKLQLRSIKTSSNEKEKEVSLKSLGDGSEQKQGPEEEKIREKLSTEETPVEEISIRKKKDSDEEENVVDYGGSLKGKVKPQEEAIDTHWKSRRKKDDLTLEEGEESENKKPDFAEDIDNYYRGKKKTDALEMEAASEDYRKKDKSVAEDPEEEKKRKSQYQDVIQDEYMQSKKLKLQPEEEMDLLEKSSGLDLDLAPADETPEKGVDYVAELLEKKRKAAQARLELEAENKKREAPEAEDLGGHYKGKVNNLNMDLEEGPEIEEEKKNYDNSDLMSERDPSIEIELSPAEKKKRQEEAAEEKKNRTHDGEVDKIEDENMDGEGSTDHIETFMGGVTTTRKNSREAEAEQESADKEKEDYSKEDEGPEKLTKLDLEAADQKDRKKEKANEESDTLSLKKTTALSAAEDSEEEEKDKKEKYESEKEIRTKKTDLDMVDGDGKNREKNDKDNEDDGHLGLKKLSNTKLEIEKERESNNGKVDKIDTFYRGGDAKKQEQNWDNLTEKKNKTELAIIKTQKAEVSIGKTKNDAGEITIDYRKLKEEFDQISRGEEVGTSGAFSGSQRGSAVAPEDEGSFRVIDLNTHGLDAAIPLLNLIFQKNIKPKAIYTMLAEDILSKYNGTTVFWEFRASEKKHIEVYNSYLEMHEPLLSGERKMWWTDYKKDETLFWHFQNRSMSTWRCPEVMDSNLPWEDIELPSWAAQELADKRVELAFPYFDGVDRMGLALVNFHDGLRPEDEHAILTTLEMARHLFLDTIQRIKHKEDKQETEETTAESEGKNKVLSFFGGLFGKKKTG